MLRRKESIRVRATNGRTESIGRMDGSASVGQTHTHFLKYVMIHFRGDHDDEDDGDDGIQDGREKDNERCEHVMTSDPQTGHTVCVKCGLVP